MKLVHRSFVLAVAAALITAAGALAQAQTQAQAKTPEEASKEFAERLRAQLHLSDAQTAKVQAVRLDTARKLVKAREDAAGDRNKLRTAASGIVKSGHAELQKILTPDQWKTYQEMSRGKREQMQPPPEKPATSSSVPPKP